jgi:DNA-binding response OmpR family regulator
MERRILVVDDDDGLRDLMVEVLERAGYRSSCASDGEAGWTALRSYRFDALITDHEMPRLTGLDLLRRLREVERTVPVILTSGNMPGGDTDLPSLLPPGVALQKPFSLIRMLDAVRGLLDPASAAMANLPPRRAPDPYGQHPISRAGRSL